MTKYPVLSDDVILRCINRIEDRVFDTYEFIDILLTVDEDYVNVISRIGDGWKKVIGKRLSKYSVDTIRIKKMDDRKGYAQLWSKS
jgi:hypothetical protein